MFIHNKMSLGEVTVHKEDSMISQKLRTEAKTIFRGIVAVTICSLLFILIVFFLEGRLRWEHSWKTHMVALIISTVVFVVGYLMPFETGMRFRRKRIQ